MATMILGAAGGFLGGPIGRLVGGLIGGVVDQWLFGQQKVEGPRLEELRVPSFDEGTPAPWVQGPTTRVPCQLLWMSKVREVKSTSGGKGGGGGTKTVTYEYYVDLAIAFARQTLTPSKPVRKLWANGQLVYEADKTLTKTSTSVSATKKTINKNFGFYCANKSDEEQIIYEHSSDPEFFAKYKDGQNVTITGFTNAVNNGTFKVIKVERAYLGGNKSRLTVLRCQHLWSSPNWVTPCTDSTTCVSGTTEAAGNSVTFVQATDEWDKGLIESVTQYRGTTSQNPDTVIEATEGSGKTPAYRGTAYMVIKNLKITRWGGTIPAFDALVQEATSRTVGEALVALVTRNGALTSADVDVTAVTQSLLGLAVMGPKDPKAVIQMIMTTYDLEVQDRSSIESGVFKNKLVFFPKASADLRTIDDDDRGARSPDSDPDGKDLIGIEQSDPDRLPAAVVIGFVDPEQDYQPGSRSFRRAGAQTETQSQVTLPLTLTASNALALAKKVMWALQSNGRYKISLTLPPTYIDLAEADRITVSDVDGLPLRGRVSRVDRGANGLITVEAVQEVESVYSEPASGEDMPG